MNPASSTWTYRPSSSLLGNGLWKGVLPTARSGQLKQSRTRTVAPSGSEVMRNPLANLASSLELAHPQSSSTKATVARRHTITRIAGSRSDRDDPWVSMGPHRYIVGAVPADSAAASRPSVEKLPQTATDAQG